MGNEDIDLKQPEKNAKAGNNDLIKTIIINVAATSLLCIIFICANVMVQTHLLNSKLASMNPTEDTESADATDSEEIQHGVVVDLGDFILNLADEDARRYLKANVALELSQPADATADAAAGGEEAAKKEGGEGGEGKEGAAAAPSGLEKLLAEYKPAIRDAVITNLSSKTAAELSTVAGKELAKEQITSAVNGILQGQNEVLRVSFGQFIIQ